MKELYDSRVFRIASGSLGPLAYDKLRSGKYVFSSYNSLREVLYNLCYPSRIKE